MKKKMEWLAALAALALAFGIAACTNVSGDDGGADTEAATTSGGTATTDTTETGGSGTTTDPSDPATPTTPETPAEETDPEVAENVVELSATEALAYITAMTKSGTVRVTGALTSADLETLYTALQNKGTGTADGDVRIALDLSAATVTSGLFAIDATPSLVSLSLPSGLKNVDIADCPSLVSLTFPDDVGKVSIWLCASLQSVTLGKRMVENQNWGFLSHCPALTEIKLTPSVTGYIVEDGILYTADKKTLVAYPCGKTATTFAVPSGVETIGNSAFAHNTTLTRVTMPSSVTTVGRLAFLFCELEAVKLSDALTSIGYQAFGYCAKLAAVTIPQKVLFIGAGAFAGCEALTRVDFADTTGWYETSVERYEDYAGDGTLIAVSDAAAMAEKLRSTAGEKSLVKKP